MILQYVPVWPSMYKYILSYNWYVLAVSVLCRQIPGIHLAVYSWTVLDINLLNPSRVEFLQDPATYCGPDCDTSSTKWLEYIYRTAHPILHW